MEGNLMIYGYIRVSTEKQTAANQRFEIENFALQNELNIDYWIEEVISSKQKLEKRKLGKLLKKLKPSDIIIATEISRLGRNLLQVMGILHFCMSQDIKVWTIKDNYRLGSDIQSKVLAFAFGLSAEIERNLISQRTKEALARLKAEGRHVGRVKGSKNKKLKLNGKERKIANMLEDGIAKMQIARITNVNRTTLYRFLKKTSV